jgi:hypothetical protein
LLREHNDTVPADDPDDSIDPDDAGPRLVVTLKESPADEIYALPEPLKGRANKRARSPYSGAINRATIAF